VGGGDAGVGGGVASAVGGGVWVYEDIQSVRGPRVPPHRTDQRGLPHLHHRPGLLLYRPLHPLTTV